MSSSPADRLKEFRLPVIRSDRDGAAVRKAAAEIMAAEDQRVFDALDDLLRTCRTEGHPGHGKPISECTHPDFVVFHIHDC